jgi:hypothetical protein
MKEFKLIRGSVQERFMQSRAKVQLFAGGYAGGKTACLCVKGLSLIEQYPGMNVLAARETYPKLNDTLRKEFFKWCPEHWIERMPTKDDNTCILKDGTIINFRYVKQQGKDIDSGTSNLLSATYDLILVDQIEDPGILEKDFLDLMGRLRGSAKYEGDDLTMPHTGPRWFIASCNPSRNWVYRKLVRPLHIYRENGHKVDDLMVNKSGEPVLDLIEGSTYDNADNLEPDYIEALEAMYHGQMADRFLKGQWAAYEGLVYPAFDDQVHVVPHAIMLRYLHRLKMMGWRPGILEGYDHGLQKPSCYLLAFTDHKGNVLVIDGFYAPEQSVGTSADEIERIRSEYGLMPTNAILADPAIFKRGGGDKKVVGIKVSDIFNDCGILMVPGNNEIMNGVTKVRSYLASLKSHRNPFTGAFPAPHIYFSDKLEFVNNEITDYFWQRDTNNEIDEKPIDRNDHAMDTIKYMLSEEATPAEFVKNNKETPEWMFWHDAKEQENEVPARRRSA